MIVNMILKEDERIDHFNIEAGVIDMLTITEGLRMIADDENRHYNDRLTAKKLINEIHKSYKRRDE